jgi:peroxiredoxin (alkyl hydroperoxide reductase subunit C)
MVDALQFFEANGELCPANWHPGGKSIDPENGKSREFFANEYAEMSASGKINPK